MPVAKKIQEAMERASWIRRMFEEGARLKKIRGEDRVFDFSLGNPCLDPPERYRNALRQCLDQPARAAHGYMPNAGYPETREAVARDLRSRRGCAITGDHIVMTCGAAGGLNVVLKTLLNPGDEVIVLVPFFPEYLFYVENHGGRVRLVHTLEDFRLDLRAIEEALSPLTRAILLNSPNNPTGRMYSQESLARLGALLDEASRKAGRPVYLISDEPYGDILFDGRVLPDLFRCYAHTILVNSYSKSLSIPGERLGYIAVHPDMKDAGTVLSGLTFSNRVLGFVNAPALQQRAVAAVADLKGPASEYQRRRDLLCSGLERIGYRFHWPDGAFYLFAPAPDSDEMPFVEALLQEGVLVVPGRGFGKPGYFRVAFCVDEAVIVNALPAFEKVFALYRRRS
jgi:aspartate aminotransferase